MLKISADFGPEFKLVIDGVEVGRVLDSVGIGPFERAGLRVLLVLPAGGGGFREVWAGGSLSFCGRFEQVHGGAKC